MGLPTRDEENLDTFTEELEEKDLVEEFQHHLIQLKSVKLRRTSQQDYVHTTQQNFLHLQRNSLDLIEDNVKGHCPFYFALLES